MQNIFKLDAVNSIRNIRITTERLARVMKKDSLKRKRDYNQISELNFRLKRVIPIIPLSVGAAGAIAGGTVSSGLPLIPGFRYFSPGRPPVTPGFPGRPGRGPNRGDPPPEPEGSTVTEPVPEPGPATVLEPEVVPEPETVGERSPEYSRARQEKAKALAEAERERKRLLGEQEGQTGTPVLEPALISEKLKEIYGEQFPEIFEEGPAEVPTIIPTEKPIKTPERELPPPLRLIQGFLDIFKLNEVARQTTALTLGQSGAQEKIREILELSLNDQAVAEKIVQLFGLSTQLIPLIKLAYNLIPVGPAKYKKLFTAVRFVVNSARQGNLNPARIKQIKADVERYVRTGSFFKGVPDAQRLQSAGMIRAQGARGPAGGYTNPLTGGPSSNIFRQTEFARKIQQALGDNFPRVRPPQGMKNPYEPGNTIVPFDIRNLGTLVRNKKFEPPKYLERLRTEGGGIFNRNPKPKKGETQVQPGDIRSQIERSGGFQDSDGNFYIFRGPQGGAPGPQASADTLIQPIIIVRGTAA